MNIRHNPHESGANREIFYENMSMQLLRIYEELNQITYLTRDSFPPAKIQTIEDTLDDLATQAGECGDESRRTMLKALASDFYMLQTTGIIDDPKLFPNEAGKVMNTLELVLLAMDGLHKGSAGRALELYKQTRPNLRD